MAATGKTAEQNAGTTPCRRSHSWGELVARRRPVRLEVMLVVIKEVLPAGWWSVTPTGGWGACRGLGTGGVQSGQPAGQIHVHVGVQ